MRNGGPWRRVIGRWRRRRRSRCGAGAGACVRSSGAGMISARHSPRADARGRRGNGEGGRTRRRWRAGRRRTCRGRWNGCVSSTIWWGAWRRGSGCTYRGGTLLRKSGGTDALVPVPAREYAVSRLRAANVSTSSANKRDLQKRKPRANRRVVSRGARSGATQIRARQFAGRPYTDARR